MRKKLLSVPGIFFVIILTMLIVAACSAQQGTAENLPPKRPPDPQLSARLTYCTTATPAGPVVEGAWLQVNCRQVFAPGVGREPQCLIGLAGLPAAGWDGIAMGDRSGQERVTPDEEKKEARETGTLIVQAKFLGHRADGAHEYQAEFHLRPQESVKNGENLTSRLQLSYRVIQGDSAEFDRTWKKEVSWENLDQKEVDSVDHYLAASALVAQPGDKIEVKIRIPALFTRSKPKINVALGLVHPQAGLIKKYGPVTADSVRVQIPADLPAGLYYFLVADPTFAVNSGIGTGAYLKIVNPEAVPVPLEKAPRRLVTRAVPVYGSPLGSAPKLGLLSPGAVVRVLADKETGDGRWFWVTINVYEAGQEKAGWVKAGATVPLTPENYLTAREVRLQAGAKYHAHERYRRGDLAAPENWRLPEEVLWIVERQGQMVRLKPSEDVSLAVSGEIWATAADLVYFRE